MMTLPFAQQPIRCLCEHPGRRAGAREDHGGVRGQQHLRRYPGARRRPCSLQPVVLMRCRAACVRSLGATSALSVLVHCSLLISM